MVTARSLGPALVGNHWQAHCLYWAAPITAALAAARVYDFVRPVGPPRHERHGSAPAPDVNRPCMIPVY
ncbi:MAG: aquaporin [Gemmatimonadetes bacterium]|nr:aquaporin [Gemmatimonadota bacterium]